MENPKKNHFYFRKKLFKYNVSSMNYKVSVSVFTYCHKKLSKGDVQEDGKRA